MHIFYSIKIVYNKQDIKKFRGMLGYHTIIITIKVTLYYYDNFTELSTYFL